MVADTAKGLKRVQVKGTQGVGPSVRMCISRKSGRYKVSEVDLVVLYLFEYTTWYLIPIRKVRRDIVIKPGDPKCRWNRFKEAWHLLA